jgi:hypothetical protein
MNKKSPQNQFIQGVGFETDIPFGQHQSEYFHQIGNAESLLDERPFKDMHHPIVKAIWNVDRFNPRIDDKLKELRVVLNKHDPDIFCDVLHDLTGQPIAQATPLLIACFEGEADVIKLIIDSNVNVNETESEHHLTALHVICDAEYQGQTLRVYLILKIEIY